jgi:hypothetical protein
MLTAQSVIGVLYYLISAFFLLAIARNFLRSGKAQDIILYGIVMVPFILRLLRLK